MKDRGMKDGGIEGQRDGGAHREGWWDRRMDGRSESKFWRGLPFWPRSQGFFVLLHLFL